MEEELEDSFRRGMAAVNTVDVDAALEVVHPEIEFLPARSGVQGTYHGHEGIRRFFEDNAENFELFRVSYNEFRHVAPNRMVALGTVRVRGKSSGVEAEVPSAVVVDYREGRLIRFEDLSDEHTAMTSARARG